MYTKNYKFKYLEWFTPEEIHQTTLQWQSTLDFITHEHDFLYELLHQVKPQIKDAALLKKVTDLITQLSENKKEVSTLTSLFKTHRNALAVLVDGINELQKEKAFKDQHLLLSLKFETFNTEYRKLKYKVFEILRSFYKSRKQNTSPK